MRTLIHSVLIEFGPVTLFFATYVVSDFFTAIWANIIATACAVGYALYDQRRIAWFPIVTLVSVLVFGGSSLFFKSETLYILQDTIGSLVFAGVFLVSVWRGRPILEAWFRYTFAISERGWRVLTIRWGVFFLLLGISNEAVRLTLSPEAWVVFKAGTTLATILFGLYQFRLSMRERIEKESNRLGLRTVPIPIDTR